MAKRSVLLLLEHLGDLVNTNFQIAGKVMLDREQLAEIIDKIRTTLPEELREAEWISREKNRYLQEAQQEAERILREAEGYAARLVQQDQIVSRAEEEARVLLDQAQQRAVAIETEARQYADQILKQLEENLERTVKVIHKGREELKEH